MLEDKPIIFVIPVSLYHQVLGEIHRFLGWKLFDVYGYTGDYKSRVGFWQEGWTQGAHQQHRRIVLATSKVHGCQD